MGYAVGVDFGSVLSTAAIVKWDNNFPSEPPSIRVAEPVPSVVFVNSDNELMVGHSAQQRGEANPQGVIRDFKCRLGDPVPIMVGDWTGKTETIVAEVIRHIVSGIAAAEAGPPDAIAVTHPASWGAYKRELLLAALLKAGLAEAGLTQVTLVSEPQAAATSTALLGPGGGRTLIVYDLGGGSFEAAVMVRVDDGDFTMVGHSQGLEWLGGRDFDQAVFSQVRRAAGLKTGDTTDQEAIAHLRRLRRDCTIAKESLSIDTEATVTVHAAGRRTRIRLVRSEFEELIRDAIDDTVDATRRAITSAGLAEQDIDAIVLAGGSCRIPLVAQVVSAEFSLPIIIDAVPEASTSLGAAWLAKQTLRATSAGGAALDNATDTPAPPPDELPAQAPTPPVLELPGQPPAMSPGPAGGSGVAPAGRRDQPERHGRHRRRGSRRYWIHVAGIVAAVAAIISTGSALATSQASDLTSPGAGPQANATSTPTATATGGAITGGSPTDGSSGWPAPDQGIGNAQPATTAVGGPSRQRADDAAALPGPASAARTVATLTSLPWVVPDAAPDAVGAPAIVLDLSELLPPDLPATGSTATGASRATS